MRKEEERKKALDARLRFEQERMEQERLEQEERERRYREREEQIEEHRHGWAVGRTRLHSGSEGLGGTWGPSQVGLGQEPILSRFSAGGSSRAWRRRRPGSA